MLFRSTMTLPKHPPAQQHIFYLLSSVWRRMDRLPPPLTWLHPQQLTHLARAPASLPRLISPSRQHLPPPHAQCHLSKRHILFTPLFTCCFLPLPQAFQPLHALTIGLLLLSRHLQQPASTAVRPPATCLLTSVLFACATPPCTPPATILYRRVLRL